MAPMDFVYQVGDTGKLREYLHTLVRILHIEREAENPWRFSQTAPPDSQEPAIFAKAGYINKLENEGVVERVYDANSRVTYHLAVPEAAVVDVLDRFADLLDSNHEDEFRRLAD